MMFAKSAAAALLFSFAAHATPAMPGPSLGLWDEHYAYALTKLLYVSPTGSDTTGDGTQAAPWATLQHANDVIAAAGVTGGAGTTVMVEPGTYAKGVYISAGGSGPQPANMLAYRCAKMDACTVTDVAAGGQNGSFVWKSGPSMANYVAIDGFVLSASRSTGFGQGVELWDGNDTVPNSPFSAHHVWILNSIISGFGQSGIQMNDGEYFYVIHNTVYNNAGSGCSAQGSGISYAELKAAPSYTRLAVDSDNPVVGNIGSFNNAIEWNIVYNNATTKCGTASNPYDSDGNNIILDTLNNAGGTGPAYPNSTLVAFNLTYNAGGRGIHIFRSENVTVANNSCYKSALDVADNATYRPCIGSNIAYGDTFFNNIAYSIAANPSPSAQCTVNYGTGAKASCLEWNNAYNASTVTNGVKEVFNNNMAYCAGPLAASSPCMTTNGATFTNNITASPGWKNVGATSTGSETTPPIGASFCLAAGSPAIGKGLRATYLHPQSVDMGAIPSTASCP